MPPLIDQILEGVSRILGLHVQASDLTFVQMATRTLVVFLFGVLIVRLADRRLIGKNAGFDVLLAVILGSVLSRGINGQASFFPTLGASALLILLHHFLAVLACHSSRISGLVKGQAKVVVKNGMIQKQELDRCRISADDLEENLRLNGNVSEMAKVKEARLERNGTISVVKEND